MSGVRSWNLYCDGGCGETMDDGSLGHRTLAEARDYAARANGAHVNQPGGTDLCDDCWRGGSRIEKHGRHIVLRTPTGSRNITAEVQDEGVRRG